MAKNISAAIRQMIRMSSWVRAALDSSAKSPRRLSAKPISALINATRLLSKPPCPAELRNRVVSPIIQRSASAPENHPEDKTDPERGHDRFGRVFAHILLR